MCLYRVGRNKVAKEDIVVYKLLTRRLNLSPFQKMEYKANTVYNAKLGRAEVCGDVSKIYEGLHAYVGKCARMLAQMENCECKVVKMVIPAGTKYALGEKGDIVSECLLSGDLKPVRWRCIPKTMTYLCGIWSYDV